MRKYLPIPYPLSILLGILLGCVLAFRTYIPYIYWGETEMYNWERQALSPIVNYLTWGLLLPFAVYMMFRFPFKRELNEKVKSICSSIGVAALLEAATYVVYYIPMQLLGIESFKPEFLDDILFGAFPSGFISRLIEYWIIYGLVMAWNYYKEIKNKQVEIAQIENQLVNAKLNALRYQLQPHFLFNTLNAISSLMEDNVKQAQTVVSKLGNLLRTVLDHNQQNTTTLSEELNFIKSYLDIEQVRFQDRLEVTYNIDEAFLQYHIPSLILQPLVENAIKHGISRMDEAGKIEIEVKKPSPDRLSIRVSDNGPGVDRSTENPLNNGIGLNNIKERLEKMYGNNCTLNIHTEKNVGFSVDISIPVTDKE